MQFTIVLLYGIVFGICILTSNLIAYANSSSNNSTLNKNNTISNLLKSTNSSNNNNNNKTPADLSPDLGYHYEYNFY